jgi:hypothetical protein
MNVAHGHNDNQERTKGFRMMAGEFEATPVRRSFQMLVRALTLIAFASTTAGVIAFPAIMRRLYGDGDYSVIADVGQAYGGASAVVACIALLVLTASILLQYRQIREVRRDAAADFAEDLLPAWLLRRRNPPDVLGEAQRVASARAWARTPTALPRSD